MTKSTLQAPQTETSRDQLREQIRQTVNEARKAAQDAARDAQAERGVIVLPPQPPLPPGVPGVTVQPFDPNLIPPQVESISIAFFIMVAAIIIGLPLMRAIARRIDRGAPPPQVIPTELRDQMEQISQSLDAIAVEVERISENQRFTTKLLSEKVGNTMLASPVQSDR
ncbi:MAG: hypothetical protein H0U59_00340 [Gemmatimonadaceae bacterium]|nr:hypothetical protein [Gemmatimonadaceae bacterium]MDQ3242701.1 hypothetical protein [Gemmatimonadota bacterium]